MKIDLCNGDLEECFTYIHNMVFRPTENFLAASEGPTFVKISTFYHVFGASTPPSRGSSFSQLRLTLDEIL